MIEISSQLRCHAEDLAAYLDGELSETAASGFEDHLKSCQTCADELRVQRQLLCTLDVAFKNPRSFVLPENFARIVSTRAENDLSGMRKHSERRRALKLCAILALLSFALMGAAARAIILEPVKSFVRATAGLLDLCWQAIAEMAASAAVVLRLIARAAFFSQNAPALLGLLFLSIFCLLFVLARYHRAQIVE
jgi:anti-sigma factor RsiW